VISDKKRLEIANVCYANVSGQFAMFCNPQMRGPNFKWDEFATMMEEDSDIWMYANNIRGHKETIYRTARQYAREIAERLVKELTK
jgi:hypothetical protein